MPISPNTNVEKHTLQKCLIQGRTLRLCRAHRWTQLQQVNQNPNTFYEKSLKIVGGRDRSKSEWKDAREKCPCGGGTWVKSWSWGRESMAMWDRNSENTTQVMHVAALYQGIRLSPGRKWENKMNTACQGSRSQARLDHLSVWQKKAIEVDWEASGFLSCGNSFRFL